MGAAPVEGKILGNQPDITSADAASLDKTHGKASRLRRNARQLPACPRSTCGHSGRN